MTIQFFLPMVPPTVTHQEKQVAVVSGRPRFYEPAELKAARVKLRDALVPYRPEKPMQVGVGLYVKWCFPRGRHPDGSYRITKPDTDNLQKLLKDVMTGLGFWEDDAHVAFELVEKFWAEVPGIFIRVETLP